MSSATTAVITNMDGSRLTDTSAIVINGVTYPIPATVDGGHLAPRRIVAALHAAGYRPATDYYSDLAADGRSVRVVPA
jgi:hypothetical protein